jgi:hypothetical protein
MKRSAVVFEPFPQAKAEDFMLDEMDLLDFFGAMHAMLLEWFRDGTCPEDKARGYG